MLNQFLSQKMDKSKEVNTFRQTEETACGQERRGGGLQNKWQYAHGELMDTHKRRKKKTVRLLDSRGNQQCLPMFHKGY
jgi:hypothetical protein